MRRRRAAARVQLPARGRRRDERAPRATSSRTGSRATATWRCSPISRPSAASRGSTRPRSCCATSSTRSPARRSRSRPGASCNARSSAPPTLGYSLHVRVRARVLPVPRVARRSRGQGLHDLTPHSHVIEDYHILQTTRDEYLIRADPQRHRRRGRARRVLQGRSGTGPTRDQPRVRDAVEMADRHVIYKNGAKEIASQHGRVDHVHGEVLDRTRSARRATCTRACGTPTARSR